jgi:predicted transcriptional regulator with HTH domain
MDRERALCVAEDIGVIYCWAVTRKNKKKPTNIKRHVNSFIKTHSKNIKLVNDTLVLQVQRHGRNIVRTMVPHSEAPRVLQVLHDQSGHFGVAKT